MVEPQLSAFEDDLRKAGLPKVKPRRPKCPTAASACSRSAMLSRGRGNGPDIEPTPLNKILILNNKKFKKNFCLG